MERNYRIIKITYNNGVVWYKIQRECKHLKKYVFWGPKVWKTYVEVCNENRRSHTNWTFYFKCGEIFRTEDEVRNQLVRIKHLDGYKIDKTEII